MHCLTVECGTYLSKFYYILYNFRRQLSNSISQFVISVGASNVIIILSFHQEREVCGHRRVIELKANLYFTIYQLGHPEHCLNFDRLLSNSGFNFFIPIFPFLSALLTIRFRDIQLYICVYVLSTYI